MGGGTKQRKFDRGKKQNGRESTLQGRRKEGRKGRREKEGRKGGRKGMRKRKVGRRLELMRRKDIQYP